jgi:protein gp37
VSDGLLSWRNQRHINRISRRCCNRGGGVDCEVGNVSTKIEWCKNKDGGQGKTWNPVTGCTKISPGCQNCYAERMAKRLRGRCGYDAENPFKATLHPNRLEEPLRWRKPSMIFVCSMGDLFYEGVPFYYIYSVFITMKHCPQHTFLVLTKRPKRMKEFIVDCYAYESPSGNVWLGVTAENRPMWDERVNILKQLEAAKKFVSYEPALGSLGEVDLSGLDWIICGGETGPHARPVHPDWVRGLRDQCQSAGVPFFFKQWGEYCFPSQMPEETYQALQDRYNLDVEIPWKVGKKAAGRLLDGREWSEMPEVAQP